MSSAIQSQQKAQFAQRNVGETQTILLLQQEWSDFLDVLDRPDKVARASDRLEHTPFVDDYKKGSVES